MAMPFSGIIDSLCVVVLLNTVLIHLVTVCFYEDAPTVTTLQQEAVISPNMIVDAWMVSSSITTCGTIPKDGWLGAIHPPHVLLTNRIILMDAVQPDH